MHNLIEAIKEAVCKKYTVIFIPAHDGVTLKVIDTETDLAHFHRIESEEFIYMRDDAASEAMRRRIEISVRSLDGRTTQSTPGDDYLVIEKGAGLLMTRVIGETEKQYNTPQGHFYKSTGNHVVMGEFGGVSNSALTYRVLHRANRKGCSYFIQSHKLKQ